MISKNAPESFSFKRITVALDCSSHSKASLNAATEIARTLNAELSGIYVEDINLVRMAALPFAEEIQRISARQQPVDSTRIEQSLRRQSRLAGEMLREAAEPFRIRCSFKTLRGQVAAEVLAAALSSDLLVLGRTGKTPVCRKSLGTTAKTMLTSCKTSVLLMRQGFSLQGPVLVLFDGSEGSVLALLTATAIAGQSTRMHILLVANSPEKTATLKEKAESILPPLIRPSFHEIPWTGIPMLLQCIRMIDSGLLVASDTAGTLSRETIHELIEKLDYPVLLIRKNSGDALP